MTRLLLLPLAALLLGGCSLFGGDHYDDLALGEFRISAAGRSIVGPSAFEAFEDLPFAEARVILIEEGDAPAGTEGRASLIIPSDRFLNATLEDSFEPDGGTFHNGFGRAYRHQSGEVEIERVSGSRVGGRFSFRMRYSPFSGGGAETITVEGGFYVDTAE